ncbi:MAG: Hsp20/alpha crystallin family protein [Solirubrobacterales bacterium]
MDASGEYIRTIQVCQRHTTTGRRALHFHQYEIHALFDELIHRPWGRAQWNPPVDIREDDVSFIIEMDLPGVLDSDVQIRTEGRTLTVAGRRQLRPCDEDRTTQLCERPDGEFARMFEFQDDIGRQRVQSHWHDGVLTLTISKSMHGQDGDHGPNAT